MDNFVENISKIDTKKLTSEERVRQLVLEKYRNDLEIIENGRNAIVNRFKQEGKSTEAIQKNLSKLDKSIETLKSFIKIYEQ